MTEETFVRELERRADDVRGVPLSLEDVRGRAHGIRRRRRVTAAAVAAVAVLAIVVPTALLSGGTDNSAPKPAPPSAPQGPAASVLHDGVVTMPDGDTVPLDVRNKNVTAFAVLTDGRVVVALQEPYAVRVYAADGSLDEEYAVQSNAIKTSADGTLVAWVDENFRISVLETGVAEPATLHGIPMPGETPGSIDAVLGSGCATGGCRVLGGDYSTTTTESTITDNPDLVTSEPLRITDVSPDGRLWAVQYADDDADPQYGCVGLYDPAAQRMTARSCETANLTFSPDGQHLLGAYLENNMASEVEVFDLGLQRVGRFEPSPEVISRAGWADATHLLAVVAGLDDNTWSVVRIGLDGGDPEVVDGPVTAGNPEMYQEYLLSE